MIPESPHHIEQEKKTISIEEAVRRIRMLTLLREKKKNKESLHEAEEQLLPKLEQNVDAWLQERFVALAIPSREMPERVAQWIFESAKKNEEQKDYQDTEWQWLQEEKKKPEEERDSAYADRLSVYCMLVEDAALARKWMIDQHTMKDDVNSSPMKRIRARDALRATSRALAALKNPKVPTAETTRVPVRSTKEETTTMQVTDVWHKIIEKVVWPAAIGHDMRERIERRYAAQEEKLVQAVEKDRNKGKAVALFNDLTKGLRAIVVREDDACKAVVEQILQGVKTHIDILADVSDIGKGIAMIKKSPVYLQLFDRFKKLLTPRDRFHAQRFIRETMYPCLKKVYNGTVPEESYNRLITELEIEVQSVHDDYQSNMARIRRNADRNRRRARQKA